MVASNQGMEPNGQVIRTDRRRQGLSRRARARRTFAFAALFVPARVLVHLPLFAQTHKVSKPETVVRAVGVYEWTGDMAKPAASRLIPVSLFIDGKLQDAAVYQAQPVPLALLSGNVYELDKAGVALGTLDLAFARKLIAPATASTTYDDGWFGYGKFLPPAPPSKTSSLKPVTTLAKINGLDDADDDKPRFSSRSATPGTGGSATPTPGSAPSSTSTPADDPDRPTLHRSPGSGSNPGDTASTGDSGSSPADDPDRPTLRHHASAAPDSGPQDRVSAVGPGMDDPSRPTLHRGKPVGSLKDDDLPKLAGLPGDADLHQLAAVSDAVNHPPHDFSRAWDGDTERQAILARMQDAAHAALTVYEKANDMAPTNAAPAPASPLPLKRAAAGTAHRSVAKKTAPPPPPPEPLMEEKLEGYTLSYGGAATFVYSAHTDGLGPALRFVTLVAQVNMQGEPEIALKNVTDAAHLDRTPRMHLVDVVDAEASNRASLLFELRAQNSRQFALYRVIGGRADQTFLTGSTQ